MAPSDIDEGDEVTRGREELGQVLECVGEGGRRVSQGSGGGSEGG